MTVSIFTQILIIFGFTIFVAYISAYFRFPLIISFILSGFLIGPNGLKLIPHGSLIDNMAEIGLAMLLFTIGLEFSKGKIKNVGRFFLLGGSLQVFLTICSGTLIFSLLKYELNQAFFLSSILTLSSSALIFRILNDKKITHSLHGNLLTGISLFQDIAFVPILILIPVLVGKNFQFNFSWRYFLLYFLLFIGFLLLITNFKEKIFRYLISFHYRELNLMLALFIPLAFSILSFKLGLSFSLGAFIAGTILAESDFQLQVVSDIIPFKDIFNAFFFIAAGMLFDLKVFIANWQMVVLLFGLAFILKLLIVVLIAKIFKFELRYAIYSGFFLFPLSEFSIVLGRVGLNQKLISAYEFNIFFSTAIFSMLITPMLIKVVEFIISNKTGKQRQSISPLSAKLKRHTVIAGYGVTGKNLTLALQSVHIPFIVVDLNYQNYKRLKKEKIPVLLGDISAEEVQETVNIKEATVLVVAISDPRASRIAISKARQKNSFLQIIARTRFLSEIEDLYQLGASEVIGEEFETSIEIFNRTLRHYHIPSNVIENITKIIRNQNYAILRGRSSVDLRWEKLNALIEAGTVETFLISADMFACGKTLKNLDLRQKTAATIVAVVRAGKSYPSPRADFVIQPGDIVVITAAHQNLEQAFIYLEKGVV